MTLENKNKTLRNIIIFYVGALLIAAVGGFIMAAGQEVGGLIFILSPFVMVLIVRVLLRDGWKDAGLRLHFRRHWGWYLFGLLLYPVLFTGAIAINVLLGFTIITVPVSELLPLILVGTAVQFVPRMLFSISEEWGWRGYLEPRLASLGIPDLRRYLLVGILWGIWHFPLILSTDYTSVPLYIFLPLFLIATIFLAVIFGQMRKESDSVWPPVLMHGMENALGFAILEGGLIGFNNELFGNIIPGTITITVLYGLVAFLVLRRGRRSQPVKESETAVPQPGQAFPQGQG